MQLTLYVQSMTHFLLLFFPIAAKTPPPLLISYDKSADTIA